MAWFRKEKKPKEAVEKQTAIPEGLWIKCDECKEVIYRKEVEANLNVCPKCGYHFRLSDMEDSTKVTEWVYVDPVSKTLWWQEKDWMSEQLR